MERINKSLQSGAGSLTESRDEEWEEDVEGAASAPAPLLWQVSQVPFGSNLGLCYAIVHKGL